jgi:hypothetical protein
LERLAYWRRPVLVAVLNQRLASIQLGRLLERSEIVTSSEFLEAVNIELPAVERIQAQPSPASEHRRRRSRR